MTQPRTDAMLPADCFAGRTICITGGGTGLGRAMGERLMELGANLVICGRRGDVVEQAAAEMAAAHSGSVLAQACDVREPQQVENLIASAEERFGQIHGWINNAAGNFIAPTETLSYNAFHTVVNIVLGGTANGMLAVGKRWIAQKQPGVFLNIAATYAWSGSGFVAPSAAAKAGVVALTRSLAAEWGRYGIRANAIAPGPFPTEGAWSRLIPPEVAPLMDPAKTVPVGRVGQHGELANAASFLLSDFSAYINGECLVIDGGQWLQGAGQFNPLQALEPQQWAQIQARTRKK